MSLDYAWEKLYSAVVGMATSTSSLQERLANAYTFGFHTIGLDVNADLPPDLRASYHEIEKGLRDLRNLNAPNVALAQR